MIVARESNRSLWKLAFGGLAIAVTMIAACSSSSSSGAIIDPDPNDAGQVDECTGTIDCLCADGTGMTLPCGGTCQTICIDNGGICDAGNCSSDAGGPTDSGSKGD